MKTSIDKQTKESVLWTLICALVEQKGRFLGSLEA